MSAKVRRLPRSDFYVSGMRTSGERALMRPQDRLLYDPSLHLMGMVRLRDNGSWRLHPGRTVQEIIEADPLSHKPWTLGHAATLMADWWAAR